MDWREDFSSHRPISFFLHIFFSAGGREAIRFGLFGGIPGSREPTTFCAEENLP
jgi:hypothetical protein